jgi:hypothetical protein
LAKQIGQIQTTKVTDKHRGMVGPRLSPGDPFHEALHPISELIGVSNKTASEQNLRFIYEYDDSLKLLLNRACRSF